MRCPRCGAESEVLATRRAHDGYVMRRIRQCFNGHRWPSFEVVGQAVAGRNLGAAVREAKRLAAGRDRNRRIVAALAGGNTVDEVAQAFSLSATRVREIRREWRAQQVEPRQAA